MNHVSNKSPRDSRAFTLIELLVVVAIIALLTSVVLAALSAARTKARDARRLSDMHQIILAIEAYKNDKGSLPSVANGSTYEGTTCGGYDDSAELSTSFIGDLETGGYFTHVPRDPLNTKGATCPDDFAYKYYVYTTGSCGCATSSGPFYVIGIDHMEASSRPSPLSPGFKCNIALCRWDNQFDWVAGGFTN